MIRRCLLGIATPTVICLIASLSLFIGCSAGPSNPRGLWQRVAERQSYIAWNLRSSKGKMVDSGAPRNVQLASLPISELKKLLSTAPPPCPASLEGSWTGINRGLGSAVAGKTQYIKELRADATRPCAIGHGSNILVERVPIEQLNHHGWRPLIDCQSGCVKRQGRYAIVARGKTEFDYSLGENPFWEPSRFLVDEIVQIDEGLLLGRANFQVGYVRIPVAYFTLERIPSCNSHTSDCN